MKKVELQKFDKEFVLDRVQWVNKNLDYLYDDMNTLAIGSYVLEKDIQKCSTYLHYAMKAILGHFEQAAYPGQQVEVEVCGEKIYVTGRESHDYKLGPSVWADGVFLSIILRDKESIQKFLNIPTQVMLKAELILEEVYFVYMAFLKSLLSGNPDTGKILIEAYKLSDPKLFKPERLPDITTFLIPELELFIPLLSDNQEEFNQYLEKALLKHKEYFTNKPKIEIGLISTPLTAICVLAYERGLKIEVESDYIPRFLIEGKF